MIWFIFYELPSWIEKFVFVTTFTNIRLCDDNDGIFQESKCKNSISLSSIPNYSTIHHKVFNSISNNFHEVLVAKAKYI